jgi:hypothetical protein
MYAPTVTEDFYQIFRGEEAGEGGGGLLNLFRPYVFSTICEINKTNYYIHKQLLLYCAFGHQQSAEKFSKNICCLHFLYWSVNLKQTALQF